MGEIKKYLAAGETITDEFHENVGSSPFNLDKGAFLGGANVTIRTGQDGGGTLLTETTDYTIGGEDTALTTKVGSSVYTTIEVTNVAYQATSLFIAYKVVASYNNLVADYANTLLDNNGRNDWINGCLRFWQRGTSFVAIAHNAYCADRIKYSKSGAMVHTISRESTILPDDATSYSLKVDCTTIDAAITGSEYCSLDYHLEGYNVRKYIQGGYGTLSYWVYSDTKTGIMCVAFRNSGEDRSYIVETEIYETAKWEKKIITIPFNFSGGSWNYLNGRGLTISVVLAAGSNLHNTKDQWNSANDLATSNQDNFCDNTANNIYFAQLKFESGEIATPFIANDYSIEEIRCERYFEKTYNIDTAPGTNTLTGAKQVLVDNVNNSDHTVTYDWFFKIKKRASSHTVTLYSQSGASGKINMANGDVNGTAQYNSEDSVNISGTNGAASTSRYMTFQATCDSEL